MDVQRDFMEPEGRLYVKDLVIPPDPGANLAPPTIVEAVEWMREHARVMVYTGDWHGLEDPEIDAKVRIREGDLIHPIHGALAGPE